jgi:hypothetical protein
LTKSHREAPVKAPARDYRGIVLDLAVFAFSLFLMLGLGMLAHAAVGAAAEDVRAKLAIGIFFAALVFIQPLGPVLKRWSFHQRHATEPGSSVGCVLFWFMAVYFVMMLALLTVAAVVLGQVFHVGEGVAIMFAFIGFLWCFVSVCFVYRYFVPPNKAPRWRFLATPAAERLGDASIFLNAIGLQIVWGGVTASATFTELVTRTPLGRAGSVTDFLGRLIAITACAALLYFPARIYYLAEDKHRALTWATILLANLPLIIRLTLAPAA